MQYSHKTKTGEKQIKMIQSAKKLKISGTMVSEKKLNLEEDVPEDIFLGASMVSNIVPVIEIAKSLRIGEKTQIKGKAIRVLPIYFSSFIGFGFFTILQISRSS